ncbi:MAG: phosphohydrolase, partial [Desulfobacula sp.]|nr:phosphohydrolase [Desulfobacula sp.]
QTNGTIVFNLVTDLISNSQNQPFIGFSQNISKALKKLKAFNYKHIYKNPVIKNHLSSIEEIFNFLFEKNLSIIETNDNRAEIFSRFLNGMSEQYKKNTSNPEIVRDYISGMTDSYFIRQAPEHLRPLPIENVKDMPD